MKWGEALLVLGFTGIGSTLLLALLWAPSVSLDAFESPAAQRIFYWHVPAAWAPCSSVRPVGCFNGQNGRGDSMSQDPKPAWPPAS